MLLGTSFAMLSTFARALADGVPPAPDVVVSPHAGRTRRAVMARRRVRFLKLGLLGRGESGMSRALYVRPMIRSIMRARVPALAGLAVAGAQAGHLLAYDLRFGAAAQHVQATGVH